MLNIGFIGFGEAASEISSGLSDQSRVTVYAFDILLNNNEKKPLLEEKALQCKVLLNNSLADLARQAEIIFSTVTSNVAAQVAREISPYLEEGQIFVDLNAITPATAQEIARIIEQAGAVFVDGAMVGSLKARKHKVPILLSGKDADLLIKKIAPLGFNTSFVGEQPGTASGNKLIRSVFTKGLAALLIETLVYAKKLGYYDVVYTSILGTLEAEPTDLVDRLITGTMVHSRRRLGELSGTREMLLHDGLHSKMVEATLEVIKKIDSLEIDQDRISGSDTGATIEVLLLAYLDQ